MDRSLTELEREIARYDCPAFLTDQNGRILFRNLGATKLLCRKRRLAPLLADAKNAQAGLILRPVRGERTLLWIASVTRAWRKVLILRCPSEREAAVLRPAGARAFSREEPGSLGALMEEAQTGFPGMNGSPEEAGLSPWTAPDAMAWIRLLQEALCLIFGTQQVEWESGWKRDRAFVRFLFQDQAGIARDLAALFTPEATREKERAPGLTVLLDAFARCRENGYELRLEEIGDRSVLELLCPGAVRLPAFFFQGKKRRKAGASRRKKRR